MLSPEMEETFVSEVPMPHQLADTLSAGAEIVSIKGPCCATVSPVVVQLKTEDQCSVGECNSGSTISECSENDVNVLINSINSEYIGILQEPLQAMELQSVSDTNPDSMDSASYVSYEQPHEDQSYYEGCAQCAYDANCPECASASFNPYGSNNNACNANTAYLGPIQYTEGTDLIQQPPQYQPPVEYAPPPFQEQAPPIYFVPPPQAEEWVVYQNGSEVNMEGQEIVQPPAEECVNADVSFKFDDLPAIHISPAGLITVLLKHDIAIEMTLDRSIRAINHRFHSVVAVNNVGKETCIFHKGVRIKQNGGKVDTEMFHRRKVSMSPDDINFSFEDNAFQLNRNLIAPVPLTVFRELSAGDDSISLIYSSSGYGPNLVPQCQEAITNSRYNHEKNGSVVVNVNGTKIRQERNGDVNVTAWPKRIRMSPTSGWIGIQTDLISMSIGEFWDVNIQCGKNVLSASSSDMFYVFNGWATAGFDVNRKLFTYRKPDNFRQFDGRRPAYPGIRPPPPRYMVRPPPPFLGYRCPGPRGRPPMGCPPGRWYGPRDVRRMHPQQHPHPPRHYRNDRSPGRRAQQNQNWRRDDRREQQNRPQSPETSEQSDSTEKVEKKEQPEPQPRKRMKNFKREQTREPSEAESDDEATD